jgi:hypothetical protein
MKHSTAVFIDFKKVCDSVRREVLYSVLIEFEVPIKVVRLTGKKKKRKLRGP